MATWKILDRRARSVPSQLSVGIQANKGNLSLNLTTFDALGAPEAVEILYDPDERLVGLRPAPLSARTYPVHKQGSSNTYLIAGRALKQTMEFDTSVPRRYDATMEDGILVFDLKQDAAITLGPGRPKAKQTEQMALPA